MKGNFMMKILY
jgi:hypothetical protein